MFCTGSETVIKDGFGSCSRSCSMGVFSFGGSARPADVRRSTVEASATADPASVECEGGGWTRAETESGCTGWGCTRVAVAVVSTFGGSGAAGTTPGSIGEAGFDDLGGLPGPRLAVVGLAGGFVAVVRGAAGFLVVVFAGAFLAASAAFFSSFSLSLASYSSFGGSLSVMRLRPDVSASMSSFSLPFDTPVLLA